MAGNPPELPNKDGGEGGEGEIAIVKCETTKGGIIMELHRSWSPIGYDRATLLFEQGFYDHSHFFRVVKGFLVQFGISYTSNLELQKMARQTIQDDPQMNPPISFQKGIISYAGSGENSRTSQLFIAYAASTSLGTQKWETPLGRVISGMENVESFYSYGDISPFGKGPDQGKIHSGIEYIDENFPLTDAFVACSVDRRINKSGAAVVQNKSRRSEASHEQQQQQQQQHAGEGHLHIVGEEGQHKEHASVRNDRHLHNTKNKAASSASRHRDGSPVVVSNLDAIALDAKLVVAAVIVVAAIWVCTRPYLNRSEKAKMRRGKRS